MLSRFPGHRRRLLLLPAPVAVALLGALLTAVPASAAPASATKPAFGDRATAERTLARVRDLLAPATATARREADSPAGPGSTSSPRDATMLLRDLSLTKDQLDPADRAEADQLLARPSTGRKKCFRTVCVHWSTTGRNAAKTAYVDDVARVTQHVLATYKRAGYKTPEPDGDRGGNSLLDIYLQDTGAQGFYGYCTSDRPPPSDGPYDAPAYCVLDNNFSRTQFPAHTPLQNLKVTAAHELFHAVQFAYDYAEDRWIMEATATWAEDEVYTRINDNLQYLANSPITRPDASLDRSGGLLQYGDWIFIRYLTERFPASEGGLPTLVRDIWRLADGSKGGTDDYSIKAVSAALAARGASLPAVFADFADGNRRPGRTYSEGAANHYPRAPLAARWQLSPQQRGTGWRTQRVDHLASATIRVTPSAAMRSRAWRLRLRFDLPPTARGSAADVTVYPVTGAPRTHRITLNATGGGLRQVPFGRRGIKYVEVTLANAGTHYRCWVSGAYSCQGRSTDDNRREQLKATAVRASAARVAP